MRHTKTKQQVIEFEGKTVNYIDDMPTVLEHIHGDIASGFIINDDLTTNPCFVAKGQGYFAHGETTRQAISALEEKILANLDTDEKIKQFTEKFKLDAEYTVEDFYKWHHILTGSCEMGRMSFIKNHGFNMGDLVSTKKFIQLTKNDFGHSIIRQVADAYGISNDYE